MKIYAVIPAYNESATIFKVIEEVKTYVTKIVVIDDGSTDKTSLLKSKGKLIVLRHLVNLGQGAALETGFEYARECNADIVVTFDADGQHKASDIQKVTKPIVNDEVDVVLGSRFLGKTIDIPLARLMILKLGIIFTHLYSGIKLTDTYCGIRAFSKKALLTIKLKQNKIEHASEILDNISRSDLKYKEVPVTILYNKHSLGKGEKNSRSFSIVFNLIWSKIFQLKHA